MSDFVPKKPFLRGILLHYYLMKKTAAESHRILVEVYGDDALSETTCRDWFRRFKSGDFDTEDRERPGKLKKFKDEELETLLESNSCQTQQELADSLGVSRQAISHRLKALGMVQTQGNQLKPPIR